MGAVALGVGADDFGAVVGLVSLCFVPVAVPVAVAVAVAGSFPVVAVAGGFVVEDVVGGFVPVALVVDLVLEDASAEGVGTAVFAVTGGAIVLSAARVGAGADTAADVCGCVCGWGEGVSFRSSTALCPE